MEECPCGSNSLSCSLDSYTTVADPPCPWPVVGVRRRPELECYVDTTSKWWTQLRIRHSGRVSTHVHHVADVLLQRHGQRQRVDASTARIRQVSRYYGPATILQAGEAAHAGYQRHLGLCRCTQTHNITTLNFDLDLWEVNGKIWQKCWTSVPTFIKIGLILFEKLQRT